MFVFAFLACFALAQASLLPTYSAGVPLVSNLPLVSNVPYPYGVVAPGLGFGFNNGYGFYDQKIQCFSPWLQRCVGVQRIPRRI
ncbi:hypothetical protein CEXT_330441 [Caerostris extrusa]|uniref:Uncharacterized protein n=1 Tax=Caerostris extrusa TaxID=172846 RepID=A0AAV4XHT9_CAEEX|nr:hypothetical protein CEXT_330441 [Caerostris extrusa]